MGKFSLFLVLAVLALATAAPDATPKADASMTEAAKTDEAGGDTIEAKYDDEDFFDPKKPPVFESKKWEMTAAPGAKPGDQPPAAFIEVTNYVKSWGDERGSPMKLKDMPGNFQEAGYDNSDFFAWDPNNADAMSFLTMPSKQVAPEVTDTFFEVLTTTEDRYTWPEARYQDQVTDAPRFRATPAQAFASRRRTRASRNSLQPGVWEGSQTTADTSTADAFRLMQVAHHSKQDPLAGKSPFKAGAASSAMASAGASSTSVSAAGVGGADPNVFNMPSYTGAYPYPVPSSAIVSRGLASPYYTVPVQPMIGQYQMPQMQSPPINFYSDGTRYPRNMGHWDHYADAAAAAA